MRNGQSALVLGRPGFTGHGQDRPVREACRAAEVPFVRTGTGCRVGRAVAILRDLGAWGGGSQAPGGPRRRRAGGPVPR